MEKCLSLLTLVGGCIELAFCVLVGVWFSNAVFGQQHFVSSDTTIYFNAPADALSPPYAKVTWSFALIITVVLFAYTIGLSMTRWFSTRFSFFLWGLISFAGAGAAIAAVVGISQIRSNPAWASTSGCVGANFDMAACLSVDAAQCQIAATHWCTKESIKLETVLIYSAFLIFLRFIYGLLSIWLILNETLKDDKYRTDSFHHARSVSIEDLEPRHIHHHHHPPPPPINLPPPQSYSTPPPRNSHAPSSDITITMGHNAGGGGGGWNIKI